MWGSMYLCCVRSVCLHVHVGCVCVCVCVCTCMCGRVHSSGGSLPADLPVELGSEEKQGWRSPAGLDHRETNCAVMPAFM